MTPLPWPGPGLFTAQGFKTGVWTPTQFAQKAKAEGYSWVAHEIDDFDGETWAPLVRDACHAAGIIFGIWETGPEDMKGPARVKACNASFYVAEQEGPGPWEAVVLMWAKPEFAFFPKALITNLSLPGYALFEAAGWACITEAYANENPNATPARMDFTAKSKGWSSTQPCCGIYPVGGELYPLSNYGDLSDWPGWSVYLAENLEW